MSLPSPRAFFAFLFTERLFTTISEPGAGYLFPSSLHTQFIQRFVPQYQTDSHTSVPFWFSSILPSLGETKNPSLPVSFLSLAHASIVADQVGGEEHCVTTLNVADYMMIGETIG